MHDSNWIYIIVQKAKTFKIARSIAGIRDYSEILKAIDYLIACPKKNVRIQGISSKLPYIV